MGTSTTHKSPTTPEWERVRDLYRADEPPAAEVSRRIALALDAAVREEMGGAGVVTCLEVLLEAAREAADAPAAGLLTTVASVLGAAGVLRAAAERRLGLRGQGSRFADLALDALGTSLVDGLLAQEAVPAFPALTGDAGARLAAFSTERRLHELAGRFISQDVGYCFRYFVTRDIAEFVGTGALPTVAHARALAENVGNHCRTLASDLPFARHEDLLHSAVMAPAAARAGLLHAPLAGLIEQGLAKIAAAPPAGDGG